MRVVHERCCDATKRSHFFISYISYTKLVSDATKPRLKALGFFIAQLESLRNSRLSFDWCNYHEDVSRYPYFCWYPAIMIISILFPSAEGAKEQIIHLFETSRAAHANEKWLIKSYLILERWEASVTHRHTQPQLLRSKMDRASLTACPLRLWHGPMANNCCWTAVL